MPLIQSALPAVIPIGLFLVDRNGTNQTGMTASADNKIQFTREVVDARGWFDNATNYRYTPLVSGYYLISLNVAAPTYASAATQIDAVIYKNGAGYLYGSWSNAVSTGSISTVTAVVAMNGSTDYIEGWASIPAGATSVLGATNGLQMFGFKVADL